MIGKDELHSPLVTVDQRDNDLWARNQYLYFHLKNMGLHVRAVELNGKIDQIIVAAGPPQVPFLVRSPAKDDIFLPLEGSEVGEIIGTAASFGDNVVDFPPTT